MTKDDKVLRAFADEHIRHEVGMLRKLIGESRRPRLTPVLRNAASEAFYVHARLLDEFLRDDGRPRQSAMSSHYTGIKPSRKPPSWSSTVDKQVVHLDWKRGRYSGGEALQDAILLDLEAALADFYASLSPERQQWFDYLSPRPE